MERSKMLANIIMDMCKSNDNFDLILEYTDQVYDTLLPRNTRIEHVIAYLFMNIYNEQRIDMLKHILNYIFMT